MLPSGVAMKPKSPERAVRRLQGSRPKTTGQALVEFALVVPVMVLILLIAVDFGRLLFTYIQVNNAAREAAYSAGSDLGDQVAIRARAEAEANVQGQGGEGALEVSLPSCATAASPPVATTCPKQADEAFVSGAGHQVTVGVSRPFTFLTPIIGNIFGAFAVSASATAPVVLAATADGGGGGGAGGGGGGGNPPPADACAANADFTFSELDWNKGVDFDAGDAAPTVPSCTTDHIARWEWDFGDGNLETQTAPKKSPYLPNKWPSHKYGKTGGEYTVTLKVTTVLGKSDTFSQPVLTRSK